MARNDGRIEAGQKLAGAISARAWNRAQEAADRVLGVGTGFGADTSGYSQKQIVFPVHVPDGTPFMYAVVMLTGAGPGLATQPQSAPYDSPPHASGSGLPSYLLGATYSGASGSAWCICEPKLTGSGVSANCIFSGVTFARVRVRNGLHKFAEPSVSRDGSPAYQQIQGILDSTECECAGAARILSIGGSQVGSVYWAMVLL